MTTAHSSERRSHKRYPTRLPAVVSVSHREKCPCSILDVSWGGVFLECHSNEGEAFDARGLHPGDTVEVVAGDERRRFRLRGEVCRAEVGLSHNRIGVRVSESSASYTLMLDELLHPRKVSPCPN